MATLKTPEQTAQTALPWHMSPRALGDMTPEQLNEAIRDNPQFQQWLTHVRQRAPGARNEGVVQALSEAGLPTEIPHDYQFNPESGQFERESFMERNPWVSGLLAAAGPTTAGLAGLGAAGGGAAAGAGGGGGAGAAGAGTLASTAPGFTGAGLAPTVAPALGAGAGTGGSMAGGWSSLLSNLASDPNTYATIASQLGRIGEGQAGERGAENAAAMSRNQLMASLFGTQQSASSRAAENEEAGRLSRAGFEENQKQSRAQMGLTAPTSRTRQALLGSLIQNAQPITFENTGRVQVPTIRGGMSPEAISAATRAAGGELERQAIDALLSKSDVPEMTAIPEATDFQAALLPPPQMTPYQGAGTGESILSGIGAAGNTWNTIMENLRRQQQPSTIGTTDATGA